MQIIKSVVIVAGAASVAAGALLAAFAVAIQHASEDMRNWERWNNNDNRRGKN